MPDTIESPHTVLFVISNASHQIWDILSELIHHFGLLLIAILYQRSFTSYAQNKGDWVRIIKWLYSEYWSFDMFVQILSKHAFVPLVRILSYTTCNWIINLLICDVHYANKRLPKSVFFCINIYWVVKYPRYWKTINFCSLCSFRHIISPCKACKTSSWCSTYNNPFCFWEKADFLL